MAKKPAKKLSPERKELISKLIEEFEIKSVKDIEDTFKEMFSPILQDMLEGELENHLGYEKYEHIGESNINSRNGHSSKTVTTSFGDMELEIPRDRNSTFEPQIVKKHQKDVSNIENKVISMYAKGMSTRDISSHLEDIYGIEASAEMISRITDRVLPEVKEWQKRPLESKYVVMFLDAIHYHVKEENQVVKKAVYIAIGIRLDGTKDVMGMYIGGNESAKYWLSVLNDLKSRGLEDILVCCIDGLTGFCDAIAAVYPQTDIQRCIIHQIRSSTRFVVSKDMRSFVSDLKKIYRANTQDDAWDELEAFDLKWGKKYPVAVKSWRDNWNELTSFYQYPYEMRSIIYTTNTIEGFNRQLRKVTKTRAVFPTDDSLLKLLFLSMRDITAKWSSRPKNWGLIMSQLLLCFPDRITDKDFI